MNKEIDTVYTVTDLPQNAHTVYHITDRRNKQSILSDGVQPEQSSQQWARLNDFLETVATEENIKSKPSHRGNCVFTHPRFADAADVSEKDANIVFAIDLRCVDADTYRASYHTATELYDLLEAKSASSPQSILDARVFDANATQAYEKAIEYWQSMSVCSSSVKRGGEVLIDGFVSADAITSVYDGN